MRVALFFDGQNFYSGFKDQAADRRVDFPRLCTWLCNAVGGARVVGAHYYSGVERDPQTDSARRLKGFLDGLETQPGFFVHRSPRYVVVDECDACGAELESTEEREVATRLTADLVSHAARDRADTIVLLSGDSTFLPAVQAAAAVSVPVWVATFGHEGRSQRLARAAYGTVDLRDGLSQFAFVDGQAPTGSIQPLSDEDEEALLAAFLDELAIAEERFAGGYVGLSFFLHRWRAERYLGNTDRRRELLDALVDEGRVETYEADDGHMALRRL